MLCRNCQKVKSNRPRGLCWSCYYTPGVREQFPSTSKFARRGVKDFNGRTKLGDPTPALPGSEEKVRVLMDRARLGLSLFHPQDALVGDRMVRPTLQPIDAEPEPVTEDLLVELLCEQAGEMEMEEMEDQEVGMPAVA